MPTSNSNRPISPASAASGGSGSRGRLWGRRSRPSADETDASTTPGYVPPALDDGKSRRYVTSPPRKTSGLTGNITSLFRKPGKRSSSRAESQDNINDGDDEDEDYGEIDMAEASNRRKTPHPVEATIHAQATASTLSPNSPARISSDFAGKKKSRVFYSANDDEESEDSYGRTRSQLSKTTTEGDSSYGASGSYSQSQTTNMSGYKSILRYRGFSTSIKSLFLDEALVCASIGCFGLILSNRTEYLLQIRNERRGVRWGRSQQARKTLPSRIVAYALLITMVLIVSTFCIFGFGSGKATSFADSFHDGYDYNGDDWDPRGLDDDGANKYRNYGDDQINNGVNFDDDYFKEQYYDDGNNAAYVDDGYNGDDQYKGDDGGYNGDDGAYNGDDGGYNGDDAYNGDDGYQDDYQGGYWYGGDDGYRNLRMGVSGHSPRGNFQHNMTWQNRKYHDTRGIFKLRDMNELIWIPTIDYINYEWNREDPSDIGMRLLQRNYNSHQKNSSEPEGRSLAANLRLSLIIAFLIVLGVLGRRRRMRTRYYLVRARAQEDHLFYASTAAGTKRVAFQDTREDQYEGACSHTLCGCYPVDPPIEAYEVDDDVQVNDDGVFQAKKKHHHEDFVSRTFGFLMACCCGFICKCWFQCLSICALAQEAREIRLLLPTRFQLVDFITHQPFVEYHKKILELRSTWQGKSKVYGFMPHFHALSRLSKYILAVSFFCVFLLILTLLVNPNAAFSWPDAVLLIATFLSSFAVIVVAYWIFHKSDLSLDAVIKLFAAGFLVAVPTAFFFEGVLVNVTLAFAWAIYEIGESASGDAWVNWVVSNYYLLWIFGEIFNAYIVAALTEEVCKYYTFRCVEHPDLLFLTGLDHETTMEEATEGGFVKYPFGSHQVQRRNKRRQDESDDVSVSSRSSRLSHRSTKDEFGFPLDPTDEIDEDIRTYRQKAAAVTTGMIAVAVGLACAENFLYVFLLGGSQSDQYSDHPVSRAEEWIVLLFRSIFPVHALAAAMQSVNMIRKFIEGTGDNKHRIGVGRIILPAVIMHGTFDCILLLVNVYIETSWDNYLDANEGNIVEGETPYNAFVLNLVAWILIVSVMVAGIGWYYRENRAQRLRLILLEEEDKVKSGERYTTLTDASSPQVSEVELV